MSQQKQANIEFFEQLSDKPLPDVFYQFDAQQTQQVREYVEQVLDKERAGLDRLFESMSQTFKYIPNFILHAITQRYVDPQVAARITVKLALKQALSVAGGLPPEYIAETAVYLEHDYAARFLQGLPRKKAVATLEHMMRKYPLILLDVLVHSNEDVFDLLNPSTDFLRLDLSEMSDSQSDVLQQIQRAFK